MEEKKIKCIKTLEQICETLGEEIDSENCQDIQRHLNVCPHCCAYIDSLKKTIHLYQYYINEDIPQAVDDRLWKVLNISKPE